MNNSPLAVVLAAITVSAPIAIAQESPASAGPMAFDVVGRQGGQGAMADPQRGPQGDGSVAAEPQAQGGPRMTRRPQVESGVTVPTQSYVSTWSDGPKGDPRAMRSFRGGPDAPANPQRVPPGYVDTVAVPQDQGVPGMTGIAQGYPRNVDDSRQRDPRAVRSYQDDPRMSGDYSGYQGYRGYQDYPGYQGYPGYPGWPEMMGGFQGWPGTGGYPGWPNMMGGAPAWPGVMGGPQGWPGMMGGRQW